MINITESRLNSCLEKLDKIIEYQKKEYEKPFMAFKSTTDISYDRFVKNYGYNNTEFECKMKIYKDRFEYRLTRKDSVRSYIQVIDYDSYVDHNSYPEAVETLERKLNELYQAHLTMTNNCYMEFAIESEEPDERRYLFNDIIKLVCDSVL